MCKKQLTKLRLGLLGNLIADQFLLFVIPLVVFKTSGSYTDSGIAYALEWLPRVVFLPFAGYWTDKYGQRTVFLISDSVKAVLSLFIFFIISFLYGGSNVIMLGIFGAIISLASGQTMLAFEVLISKNFKGNELAGEQARLFKIDQLSMIIGPAIAGLSALMFDDLKLFFILSALLYTANFVLIFLTVDSNEAKAEVENNHVLASMTAAFHVLKNNPVLFLFCGIAICNNFISGTIEVVSAGVITSEFGKGDQVFAMVNLGAGLAGFLSLAVLPTLLTIFKRKTLFFCSLLGIALSSSFLAYSNSVFAFIFSYSLVISSTLIAGNYLRSRRGEIIPAKNLGKTISLMTVINQSVLPISGIIVALQQQAPPSYQTTAIIGGMSLLLGLLLLFLDKDID